MLLLCPSDPVARGCDDPGAMSAARKACVGETNCTVSVREFHARCLKDVDGGAQVILKRRTRGANNPE